MTLTPSTMLPLGTPAPPFSLPDTEGRTVSLTDFTDASALLVLFTCNHCPFVKHIQAQFVEFAAEYQPKGLAVVAINSNDVANYPEDSPELMAENAKQSGFTFPYLYDETQQTARDYRAACTPDFFLFDADNKLLYRGQFDDARPGNDTPVTGQDLRAATDALLAGQDIPTNQKPSIGCNIEWKPQ